MIDTIVFDLDGTLLNTLEDLADSVNYAMEQYGLPTRTLEEVRCFVGNGVGKLIERAIPGGLEHPCYKEILAVFKAHYEVHCNDKTKAYEGILPMLERAGQEGYRLAIVSNKFDDAVKQLNEKYFKRYIKVAIGESAMVKRKPAPDTVYQALAELSSQAENAVYVGDSEVDIQTAAHVPMRCVSVTWGFRTEEQLLAAGAKPARMIRTPRELLLLLPRLDEEG